MAQNMVTIKDDLYALGKECVFSAGCRFLNLSIRSSMITKSLKYFVSCPSGNSGRCGFQEAGRRTGHGHCKHRVSFRKCRVQIPKCVVPASFLPEDAADHPKQTLFTPLQMNCSASTTRT